MSRKQCKACPWRKDVDPARDIPNGYCATKHENLRGTISEGLAGLASPVLRLMACHESPIGKEIPCAGWLGHQLGPGNNIALRMAVIGKKIDADFELVGEQHDRFEDTLPKSKRPYKKPQVQSAKWRRSR